MANDLSVYFDEYLDINNNSNELNTFYDFINDDDLNESFIETNLLVDIRNENYTRYSDIDLSQLVDLSPNYEEIVYEIRKIYNFIEPEDLLTNDLIKSNENKKIIDLIYKNIKKLKNDVEADLNILKKQNKENQKKLNKIDYKKISNRELQKIMRLYNDILLINLKEEENLFKSYNRQVKIKKIINCIFRIVNLETIDELDTPKENLNKKIEQETKRIYELIQYLEDLIIEGSLYEEEFIEFKNYFNSVLAYDDNNYSDLNNVYNILRNNEKINSSLKYFEKVFIMEREALGNKDQSKLEKEQLKENIKKTLDYIIFNYYDMLNDEDQEIVNRLCEDLTEEKYKINNIYISLKKIVNKIWENTITNIYSYNIKKDFCFICSNNQFIDEKYETILITNKTLEKINEYSNYQIGFICNFNDNILYVTEEEDIMSMEYNNMPNLITPKQIEQEFINYDKFNKLALNGYITKLSAVYLINDDDVDKYKKAVELANQYNLPLIVLKKDKN